MVSIEIFIIIAVSLVSKSFQYVHMGPALSTRISLRCTSITPEGFNTADNIVSNPNPNPHLMSTADDAISSTNTADERKRKFVFGYDSWKYRTIGSSGRKLVYGYNAVRSALLKYREINDHMLVRYKFVVPAGDDRWPEDTWGMNLGIIASNIRSRNSYNAEREDLKSIGFIFNPEIQNYRYDSVKRALLMYKDLNGDMLVPLGFVVPTNPNPKSICYPWPKSLWGVNLGIVVSNIRCGYYYGEKREDLKKIGFDYLLKIPNWGYDLIRAALVTYKVLIGDMMVHREFVVPDSDVRWPKETWGMGLGNFVGKIRNGNSHADQRNDLESIGFDYSS